MTMGSNNDAIISNSIEDELNLISLRQITREIMTHLSIDSGKAIETFLNDMISIEVLNQLDDPIFECMDDGLNLYCHQPALHV